MEYKTLCSSSIRKITGLKGAIRGTLSILSWHRLPLTYKEDCFSSRRITELGIKWMLPFSSTFFGAVMSSLRGQTTEYLPPKLPQCSPGAWASTDLLYANTLHVIQGSCKHVGLLLGLRPLSMLQEAVRNFCGPASVHGWEQKSNCSGAAAAAAPLLLNLPLICQALLSLWKSGLQW